MLAPLWLCGLALVPSPLAPRLLPSQPPLSPPLLASAPPPEHPSHPLDWKLLLVALPLAACAGMSVAIPASLAIGAAGHPHAEPTADMLPSAIILVSLLVSLALAEDAGLLVGRSWITPHKQHSVQHPGFMMQPAWDGGDQACIMIAETHGPEGYACALLAIAECLCSEATAIITLPALTYPLWLPVRRFTWYSCSTPSTDPNMTCEKDTGFDVNEWICRVPNHP